MDDRDATAKVRAYMAGWRKGAALLPIDEDEHDDPDFGAGWVDGRGAKRAACQQVCRRYGVEPLGLVRLCGETPGGEV